jgi:dipeptidase
MLTLVALERCATARCAIATIGNLASELGYYAADVTQSEAGEGLSIVDSTEAWVFHVLPNRAGDGAVWVAQKVPDDHVSVVANAFVIRGVPELGAAGATDFLTSANLWTEAEAAGLWSRASGEVGSLLSSCIADGYFLCPERKSKTKQAIVVVFCLACFQETVKMWTCFLMRYDSC